MKYAEKVMLHNLVHLTIADKKAYDKLSCCADSKLWFIGKQRILNIMSRVIDRYAYYYDIISKIAASERDELRVNNIQADLLDEVVDIKGGMIKRLKSIRQSISWKKSFSREDITNLIKSADQLVTKLRDLSDVAELLENYDVPFYKNFYKS